MPVAVMIHCRAADTGFTLAQIDLLGGLRCGRVGHRSVLPARMSRMATAFRA